MTDREIEVRMCAEYWLWFAFTTIIPVGKTARYELMQIVCKELVAGRGKP
jgi:hypothetical protein